MQEIARDVGPHDTLVAVQPVSSSPISGACKHLHRCLLDMLRACTATPWACSLPVQKVHPCSLPVESSGQGVLRSSSAAAA